MFGRFLVCRYVICALGTHVLTFSFPVTDDLNEIQSDLSVSGPRLPNRPRDLYIREVSDGLKLSWHTPDETWSDRSTYYEVEYWIQDGNFRTMGNNNVLRQGQDSILLRNPQEGKSYNFRVKACFSEDQCSFSEPVEYTVPVRYRRRVITTVILSCLMACVLTLALAMWGIRVWQNRKQRALEREFSIVANCLKDTVIQGSPAQRLDSFIPQTVVTSSSPLHLARLSPDPV